MNTIYAVVKIDNEISQFACRVYTKQSSNFEKMKEYKEEIKNKYPNAKVILTTREKAKKIRADYAIWYQNYENERIKKLYKDIMIKSFKERGFL